MPELTPPHAVPEGKGVGASLGKKVGPFPAWAWIGIGGVGIWILMSRGGASLGGVGGGQFAQPGAGGGGGGLSPFGLPSGVSPGFLGGGGADPATLPPQLAFSAYVPPPVPVFNFSSVTPQNQPQAPAPFVAAPFAAPFAAGAPGGYTTLAQQNVAGPYIQGPVPGTPFQGIFAPSNLPGAAPYQTPVYASTVAPAAQNQGYAPGGIPVSASAFGPGAITQTLSVYGQPTTYSLSADAISRGGIPANQVPTAVLMPGNAPSANSQQASNPYNLPVASSTWGSYTPPGWANRAAYNADRLGN